MAAALVDGIQEQAPAPEQPAKKVRKSIIDRDPMPGTVPLPPPKGKRTRRRKDPALCKSHSFTVLMTEQMYQQFKKVTENEGVSMNGVVTRLIRKYIISHDIDENILDL